MALDPDTTASDPDDSDNSDGPDDAENEDNAANPEATAAAKRRSGGGAQGSVLAAAMLAVGEILEPEKTVIEIEQQNDDPIDDPPFKLDFGDLPPLS